MISANLTDRRSCSHSIPVATLTKLFTEIDGTEMPSQCSTGSPSQPASIAAVKSCATMDVEKLVVVGPGLLHFPCCCQLAPNQLGGGGSVLRNKEAQAGGDSRRRKRGIGGALGLAYRLDHHIGSQTLVFFRYTFSGAVKPGNRRTSESTFDGAAAPRHARLGYLRTALSWKPCPRPPPLSARAQARPCSFGIRNPSVLLHRLVPWTLFVFAEMSCERPSPGP